LNEIELLVEAEQVEHVLEERSPAFGILSLRLSSQVAREREPRRELSFDAQRFVGLSVEAVKRDCESRVGVRQETDDHQRVSRCSA
jgi:hypothetical protein